MKVDTSPLCESVVPTPELLNNVEWILYKDAFEEEWFPIATWDSGRAVIYANKYDPNKHRAVYEEGK